MGIDGTGATGTWGINISGNAATATTATSATSAVTATNVTGTVATVNGGTGQTTYTNGQLLIGNSTGSTLTLGTLTGTANQVTVANGAGSITLSLPQDIHSAATPTFGSLTINGSTGIQATATEIAATQIPVFNGDPASTTRTLVTRTPAQLRGDIGAQASLTNPITGTGASGQVSFFTAATTQSGDNGLFWDNTNKRLGIGTTSPSRRVDVVSTDQVLMNISGSNTSGTYLDITGTSSQGLRIGRFSGGAVGLAYHGFTTPHISIASNGNVTFSGTATGTNFILSSDRRLKSNIQSLDMGIKTISKLQPKKYIKNDKPEIGFITDEIPTELDFLVKRDGEYEGLDYTSIIGVLVRAVKDLKKELDELKNKLK